MDNPRKDPINLQHVAYGQHAISLGPQKLGQILSKCLTEISLIMSIPPGPQSQNVMAILKDNLQKATGISQDD